MMTADEITAALAGTGAAITGAGPDDCVAGVAPACVAFPGTVGEAAGLLRAAASLGLAVVPRGSGHRLSWGPPPSRCDVVVDMTRMSRVIEHAGGDLVVRAEAGITLASLRKILAEAGQRLALDGPASATIGGVIATGAAGPLRLRYGTPRDLLIGITVVRPDGRVARSGGKVVKNVAGYDLGKLFAGSHGTLGLITEAAFRLHPVAAAQAYVTAEYDDASSAADAAGSAAGSPMLPSAVEIDRPRPAGPVRAGVLLEGTASGVTGRAAQMAALLGQGATISQSAPEWWAQRGEAGWGSGGTLIRIAFWGAELRRVLDAIDTVAGDARVKPAVGGPAGAGVLYACLDSCADADQTALFVRALRAALGHAAALDGRHVAGSVAGAGGPPRGSVVVLAAPPPVQTRVDMWGPVPALALMRAVKGQFDPGNRMAPGRFAGGI
jgi:glycolate oxidase FAD binding subunit